MNNLESKMTTNTVEGVSLPTNTYQTFKLQLDSSLTLNNIKIIARKDDGVYKRYSIMQCWWKNVEKLLPNQTKQNHI